MSVPILPSGLRDTAGAAAWHAQPARAAAAPCESRERVGSAGIGWLAAGVAYTIAYLAAGSILRERVDTLLWFRTIALVTPPALGALVITHRRHSWSGCQWLFWATLALGLAISAVGFVGWTVDEILLDRETPWLGWHAVFALYGGVAPLFALLAQPHRGPRDAAAATTAVDIAGIAVLAGFLYSYIVVGWDFTTSSHPSLSLVFLSQFQQFVVFAGMAGAAFVARREVWGPTYRRLAMGMLVSLVMLTLTNSGIWQGHYRSVFVYDFIWILPFFFVPWAAAAAPRSEQGDAADEDDVSAPSRPWLIFGALALVPIIDYGLQTAFPVAASLEGVRNLTMAVMVVSVLPLLMARLVVERAALGQADARLRLLGAAIEQTADLVCISTWNGSLRHANAAFCRALGYQRSALARLTLPDVTAEAGPTMAEVEEAWRTRGVWRGTLVRRRQDGSTFTAASSMVPLFNRRGAVTHVVAVERDITEESRLRDELVRSEHRYRSLFDNAPLGICRATPEGGLVTVNDAFVRMLGCGAAEGLLGCNLAGLWHDPARGAAQLAAWRERCAIETSEVAWRRGQSEITVRLSGRLLLDESSGEEAFEIFAEDVTTHRELEEDLRQAQKMEAIGRLAGGVAHDFNNQLTVICGYSELVLDQLEPDSAIRNDVQEIRRAAENSSALTRQLLAFSRRQLLRLDILDLNDVVRDVEQMLRRVIGEDILVEARLAPALEPTRADRVQLEQVLLNLAVNARDAMPAGGRLTVETAVVELSDSYRFPGPVRVTPGRYVRLVVSDTGCGMDEHTRRRLFEPFFTTKQQGKGTGLGLATVYGIVKQIGGYIWVYSEPGQGTTFKLDFPVVPVTPSVSQETAGPEHTTSGRETVLLVEDEHAVRRFAASVLRHHGYRVVEAAGADEALKRADDLPAIDLVLTDVVMPGLNGPEMLAVLRARRSVRGLYMSGYTEKLLRDGMLGGDVDLLEKPFGRQELLRKVRETLDAAPA